jgi:hypothetical protein
MEYDYDNIDLEKVYTYNELPDKQAGRCDNSSNSHFKSKVGNGEFLREGSNYGMKKSI